MSKKSKKESSDEIVINLDQFAVPGAIILAGVIIAVAVFVTGKKDTNSIDDQDTESVAGETTDSDAENEFATVTSDLGNAPYIGDKENATVAVVEYNEFKCSYCLRHLEETVPTLISDYVDTGKIIYVFREFAIYGDDAANAAKCVYHLTGTDTYKEFHTNIFNYEDDDDIYTVAKEVGVDEDAFDACYSERKYQDEVDADFAAGENVGIQGTPGFVVGTFDEEGNVEGVLIPGAYPIETFSEVIDGFLSD
jgi:protein-disulfide isomerase